MDKWISRGGGQQGLLYLSASERLLFSLLRDNPLLETSSSGRVAVLSLTLPFHGVKNRDDKETSHKRKRTKIFQPECENKQPFRL